VDIAEDSILSFHNLDTLERDNTGKVCTTPAAMPNLPVTEPPTPRSTDPLLPSRHTVVADGAGVGSSNSPFRASILLPITHTTAMPPLLGHKATMEGIPLLTRQMAPLRSTRLGLIVVRIEVVALGGFGATSSASVGEATVAASKIRNGTAIQHGVSQGQERRQSYPKTIAAIPLQAVTPTPPTALRMCT